MNVLSEVFVWFFIEFTPRRPYKNQNSGEG